MIGNIKIYGNSDILFYFFKLIVVFNVVVYCSYAYSYFYVVGAVGIKPLYWYFFTIVCAAWVVFWSRFLIVCNLPQKFILWVGVYLFYSIVSFLYSSQSTFVVDKLIDGLESVVLLLSFLVLLKQKKGADIASLTLIAVIGFAVPMNMIDFFSPAWSTVPGRAAGLYMNSNTSGSILVMSMVMSVFFVPHKFRLLYCLSIGLAVLVTFSRSSWLLWGIAVSGLSVFGYIVPQKKKITMIFALLMAVILLFSLLSGVALELLSNTGIAQYLTPNTIARLGGGSEAFSDSSAVSRSDAAMFAWELFQDRPWFGFGLGSARELTLVSPHNMYLLMAAEGGLFGVAVYLTLLVILWQLSDDLGKIMVAIISVASLFSHNLLEQPVFLFFISLIVSTHRKHKKESTLNNDM